MNGIKRKTELKRRHIMLLALTCLVVTLLCEMVPPQIVTALPTSFEVLDRTIPGDSLLLYDSTSGLEWLDLPLTVGMSYSEVESQLSLGGDFEGFRFATCDEFGDLVYNVVNERPYVTYHYPDEGSVQIADLVSNLGYTYLNWANFGSSPCYSTWGFLLDTDLDISHVPLGGLFSQNSGPVSSRRASASFYSSEVSGGTGIGSYLVRGHTTQSPVPEPSSLLLLICGILGVVGFSMKYKSN